jgi:hypothetical protein
MIPMATSVKFLSFQPYTFGNLRPAPNVTEMNIINAAVMADTTPRLASTPEDIQDKVLKILGDYRGSLLWLEGGVIAMRMNIKTVSGNGYAGWPPVGLHETVVLDDWIAEVEFV